MEFTRLVPGVGPDLERGDDGAWGWSINLPAITAALPAMEKNPLAPGDRYDGPTLFIAGGQSDYVEAADEIAIRTHFPAARIARIAGSADTS